MQQCRCSRAMCEVCEPTVSYSCWYSVLHTVIMRHKPAANSSVTPTCYCTKPRYALHYFCLLLCRLQYPKLLDVPLTGEAGGSIIMLDLLFELGMDRRLIAKMILAQPAIMEAKVKRVKALVLYLERVSSIY
jgi:hypothetical protein